MPKVGMQEVRRNQLIAATIDTIETYGFGETTIARISKRAGLSAGIISHYFGGKNALLAATMRALLNDLQRDTITRLRRARSARERIEAILAANFGASQFTPQVYTVWLAFYGQVPHSPELKRLHRVYAMRLRSNLRHAFRDLLPAEASDRAAEGMSSMLDGIWVRAALMAEPQDVDAARRLVSEYLRLLLDDGGTAAMAAEDGGRACRQMD